MLAHCFLGDRKKLVKKSQKGKKNLLLQRMRLIVSESLNLRGLLCQFFATSNAFYFYFKSVAENRKQLKDPLKVIFTLMKREKYCSTFGHAGTLDILLW